MKLNDDTAPTPILHGNTAVGHTASRNDCVSREAASFPRRRLLLTLLIDAAAVVSLLILIGVALFASAIVWDAR